jgi:hypothetical protein
MESKDQRFKKEKIAAEILASMYDASLDQFKWHSWSDQYLAAIFLQFTMEK